MTPAKKLPSGFSAAPSSVSSKVYWQNLEDVKEVAAAAEKAGETISYFLRTAALSRARTVNTGETG